MVTHDTKDHEKLAQLQKKKKQLEAQIQAKNARAATKQRKQQTRKEFISGRVSLHMLENHPDHEFSKLFIKAVDELITREDERRLFYLPPLPPLKN
ncbi:MAG: hypothetical protein K0U54_11805 [Bacteroidetes bacterium]|nr:hypothetical protein [Bacteroidota bacterium]